MSHFTCINDVRFSQVLSILYTIVTSAVAESTHSITSSVNILNLPQVFSPLTSKECREEQQRGGEARARFYI